MKPHYQNIEAVWCDPGKYPEWQTLPCSYFDCANKKNQWKPTLLEFRFFYDWDGESVCPICFSAGCRFRLMINGKFVEDGPVEPGGDYGKTDSPDWWFYDAMDVSKWLKNGRNEFLFQLLPVPIVQSDYSTGYGWVWCHFENEKQQLLPGDWQFRISGAFGENGWDDRWHGKNDWSADCVPVTVSHPLCYLNLPRLKNKNVSTLKYLFPFGHGDNLKRAGRKLIVKPGRPATFFLELPELTAGHLELRTKGNSSLVLWMEFQELYGVKPDKNAQEHFISAPGESWFRTFRIYGCRYIKIDLIPSGFHSQDISEPVEIEFHFLERGYPLGRRMHCCYPEKWMKKLDDQCLNLLKLCMQRMSLDSPMHHEALGCTGDYRIGANIAFAAYRETDLAAADLIRTSFLLRQQKKMFHTSYELCFILMMKEFLDHGGSRTLVQDCYDALLIVFEHFKAMTGPEYLISEADNYLFIDWIVDGDAVFHHPPASRGTSAMTALWYGALKASAHIAAQLGKNSDSEMFLNESVSVRKAFNQYLWNPEQQAYIDGIPGLSRRTPGGWLPPDGDEIFCSSPGNIMALAFGLPEEKHHPESLLKRIIGNKLHLQPTPYYMDYLFMAAERYHVSREDKLKLIARWKPFMNEGIREHWRAGDYSHMWSASPAYWMRKKDFL